jgi:hypothetical protein
LRGIVEGSNPPSKGVDNPQTGPDESVPCLSQFVGASRKHSGKYLFPGLEENPTQEQIDTKAFVDS